jgi:hypothetical protein
MSSSNRNSRSAGGVGMAVGAAFAAALIGLANTPAASADGPDPFEDLFGTTGINTWTTSADASLLSSSPTLAATLDTSVENFLTNLGQDDPFSFLASEFDPGGFGGLNPGEWFTVFNGAPLDATADFAMGLDYTLYASDATWLGTGIVDTFQIPYDIVVELLSLPLLPFILAGA